jgi:hypothetical protein
MEPLKDLGVTTITTETPAGTDHESFDAVGIPGFQFIQDRLDYGSRTHHSNMDTYERLQPADLAQAATVEAIFVYNTAMRDQMLPRKPLPHPELEEQRSAPLKVMPGAVERRRKNSKETKIRKTSSGTFHRVQQWRNHDAKNCGALFDVCATAMYSAWRRRPVQTYALRQNRWR